VILKCIHGDRALTFGGLVATSWF